MFSNSFQLLINYCESQNFAGWDPYDGLNSRIFQFLPLKHWDLARLAWIQSFKRSPLNLRSILLVPKEHNAKGIALFLSGYCNIYAFQKKNGTEVFGQQSEIVDKIKSLAELLILLQSKGYSGACWGYNFDWQNRVFYQPKFTPTVVATSFCADALFNAYEVTGSENLLNSALSACSFVEKDLNRTFIKDEEFIFSYSPLDHSQVYNASLLGARLLARGFTYTNNKAWKSLAFQSTLAIINKQNTDGSWKYGEASVQEWIDSFHTGFNLECIHEVMKYTNENTFQDAFVKGLSFYLGNFFVDNGTPKYYHKEIYPIDIHCPAQLIVTLSKTENFYSQIVLVEKVLRWTIQNLQSSKGFFYYQLKRGISSRIPYMRWAQAWMFYSFSHYFKYRVYENLD